MPNEVPRVASLKFPVENLLAMEDAREIPAYNIALAAQYLHLPTSTLRDWVQGGVYRVAAGTKRFAPLINLPNPKVQLLSFYNLAEAHVLSALRRVHNVKMPAIRKALDYVTERFHWERPLIQQEFKVAGASLFVERLDHVFVDAGTSGKQVMLDFIREYMTRLEWEDKLAVKFYPFTRKEFSNSPKLILIDARLSFGRPVIISNRVPTAIIAERYKAGDSTKHLARDYACPIEEIEEAVRCELNSQLAA